jgi:hypothetical protein
VANLQATLRLAAAAVLAVTLCGCDPGLSLSGANASDQSFFLKVVWPRDSEEPSYVPPVQVWELGPRTSGTAIGRAIGSSPMAIELLDVACHTIGSWASDSGGLVTVKLDGSVTFEKSDPTRVGAPGLKDATRCT